RGASRSDRLHPRPGRLAKAGIPDVAQAAAIAPPPGPSAGLDPNPAAPRTAKAPDRSSAVSSPQTPPAESAGSVISIWQRGDIYIGRLQSLIVRDHVLEK